MSYFVILARAKTGDLYTTITESVQTAKHWLMISVCNGLKCCQEFDWVSNTVLPEMETYLLIISKVKF